MLGTIDIINGITTTIIIGVFSATGIRMILKYKKTRHIALLLFGILWIGLVLNFYPIIISFWGYIFFRTVLSLEQILFIDSLTAFVLVVGIWAWSELVWKKRQKILIITFSIISIPIFCFFFYNTLHNPSFLGKIEGLISPRYGIISLTYLTFCTIIAIITGYLFYRQTRDAYKPEIRLKGLMVWIAFVVYFTGGLFDGLLPLRVENIIITRIIMVVGSILFLFGFFPPKFAIKFMNKREENKQTSLLIE